MKNQPSPLRSHSRILSIVAVLALSFASAQAQYTALLFDAFADGYAPTNGFSSSTDLNVPTGDSRQQFGVLSPATYSQLPTGSSFLHQIGWGPLQLFGDPFGAPWPNFTMVSPNTNFKGFSGTNCIGTKISFSMDVNIWNPAAPWWTWAGVSLGSDATLTQVDAATPHFGIRFSENTVWGSPANRIEFYDGNSPVSASLANPAGAAGFLVDIIVTDPTNNGDPWDGIGSTKIEVFVNGSPVGSYTKTGGGYTNNFVTLVGAPGTADGMNYSMAEHQFDSLTVFGSDINYSPVAANLNMGCRSGEPVALKIIGGKQSPTDADGDTLTVSSVGPAGNGFAATDGTFVYYTSSSTFSGPDSFTYTVSDGAGGNTTATVSVTVTPNGTGYNLLSADLSGMKFLGLPAHVYALQHTTSLIPPVSWTDIATNTAATNGIIIFTNTAPGFYRTRHL